MSSRLDDVLLLGIDSRDRSNPISFESALEDLEAMLDAQKKTLRCILPKDPIIGVPAGTDPNSLLERSRSPIGRGGSRLDLDMDDGDDVDGDGEDTEEDTRQMDESSGDLDDVVGELEDSGDGDGDEGSGHFV